MPTVEERPTSATQQIPPAKARSPIYFLLDRFDSYVVIIDSSIVVEDIRWKVLKRRNPTTPSRLDRAMDSNIFVPFVPDILADEVERNLQDLAVRHALPLQTMLDEWQLLRRKLRFITVTDDAVSTDVLRDPTDAPFVAAQRETKAVAILSNDKDILESSAPSAGRVALEQAVKLQSALLENVGATMMLAFIALLPFLLIGGMVWLIYKGVRRSPRLAVLAFAGVVLLVWMFWDKLKAACKRVFSPENKETAFEVLGTWSDLAAKSRKKSDEAKTLLESTLGVKRAESSFMGS